MTLGDLIAWEATYRVWLVRSVHGDHPASREIWAEAPLHVRVRQAERWLRLAEREAKRQATMAARRGR
jgi:hypothetical protein